MIYSMTIFEKKKFTDQDRGYNQTTIFNSKWRQTERLLQGGIYPIMVLTSCPNNI